MKARYDIVPTLGSKSGLLTSQRRMNRDGFTLLDVLLVISFVSLMAAVTFPRIADVQTATDTIRTTALGKILR